jgi:hypothetical protein
MKISVAVVLGRAKTRAGKVSRPRLRSSKHGQSERTLLEQSTPLPEEVRKSPSFRVPGPVLRHFVEKPAERTCKAHSIFGFCDNLS